MTVPGHEGALWSWAVRTYERPGVKDALLGLQDRHDVDVVLLLWRVWLWSERRQTTPAVDARAIALSTAWRRGVVAPLREARNAAKASPKGIESDGAQRLRGAVLEAELAAERLQLQALERLSAGAPQRAADHVDLVDSISEFEPWRNLPRTDLSPLAAALASR